MARWRQEQCKATLPALALLCAHCTAPQGAKTGRLLKYDPATHTATVLVRGLWYANGVAVSKDQSFVAVVVSSPKEGATPPPMQRTWHARLRACTHACMHARLCM